MKRDCTIFLLFIYFLMTTHLAFAGDVIRIQIADDQVITQKINISPGAAVLIEFSSDIQFISLTNQDAFQCIKVPPKETMITCKALTSKRYFNDLMVHTQTNEYILTLQVDALGAVNPVKYVFWDPNHAQNESRNETSIKQGSDTGAPDLLNSLLEDFSFTECRQKQVSEFAEVDCLDRLSIGTEEYLRFKIKNISHTPFTILNCMTVLQTLGGLTGLALKEESPIPSPYVVKTKSLHFGEETIGILKIPALTKKENQALVVKIQTDLKIGGDLFLKKI